MPIHPRLLLLLLRRAHWFGLFLLLGFACVLVTLFTALQLFTLTLLSSSFLICRLDWTRGAIHRVTLALFSISSEARSSFATPSSRSSSGSSSSSSVGELYLGRAGGYHLISLAALKDTYSTHVGIEPLSIYLAIIRKRLSTNLIQNVDPHKKDWIRPHAIAAYNKHTTILRLILQITFFVTYPFSTAVYLTCR
ncbi:hypothetical protein B0T17DRAFT_389352 [Bombardia bombarda]|uniref:Uncharacterized protein n=1 Tax=Bombardia bombarda TaxID=252184 RepID=A0AA39TZW1_9PEZI|nr:hypothetical protein B0T17DRAFT_389352 [Bombardia bombarda]